MHSRLLVRLGLVPLLLLSLAVAGGWWASHRDADARPALASALDALPAATVVAGFTDWSAIREDLGLGTASSAADRSALTDDAALRDLTSRSVLAGLIEVMDTSYGWSAADLDWEVFGQAPTGAVLVTRLSRSVSFAKVSSRLATLGYVRDGDVWSLGPADQAGVGPELATTLGSIALLPRQRLIVATDEPVYARTAIRTIRGDTPSMLTVRPAYDVAGALAGSDTALIQSGSLGCKATALTDEGPDVAAQARTAVARAGALRTPTFSGRGLVDGSRRQSIRFVSSFGSPSSAADQADVRAALSTGPFIGRSGRIEESLTFVGATARGSVASLRFDLDPDKGAYMSGEGPLLFASCPP